jgi:hypothetical protein
MCSRMIGPDVPPWHGGIPGPDHLRGLGVSAVAHYDALALSAP